MIPERRYFRIMLGSKSMYVEECHKGGFIGGDWGMNFDLAGKIVDDWREFNRQYIPVFLEKNPGNSKVTAGLACGMLHTIEH